MIMIILVGPTLSWLQQIPRRLNTIVFSHF